MLPFAHIFILFWVGNKIYNEINVSISLSKSTNCFACFCSFYLWINFLVKIGKLLIYLFLFCSHLHNVGDIVKFVITSEEAIAKGIRRIVAITGADAEKVST